MLAGETVFALLTKDGEEVPYGVEVTEYEAAVADSWCSHPRLFCSDVLCRAGS